jgi:DNA-binding transcriptional regulator YhcF (GntR family)
MPVLSVDPADTRPAWKQVAAELTEATTSGVLLPGDELPSITEAGRLQGIGTGVIRHALEVLTADGLIVARRKVIAEARAQRSTRPVPVARRDHRPAPRRALRPADPRHRPGPGTHPRRSRKRLQPRCRQRWCANFIDFPFLSRP